MQKVTFSLIHMCTQSHTDQERRRRSKKMRNPSAPTTTCTGNHNNTSRTPCCSKVGLKRGPWTPEEDELLASYITKEGEGRWRTLPKRAGLLRCGKSCRLRWMNYLRPSVKRGHIAPDEEDLILRLHRLLGNRWSLIAGRIPGRTDNEIKNYWNTHLSKKLISQGIDPRTHKPLSQSDLHQSPTANPNPNPNPNMGLEEDGGHGQSDCTQETNPNPNLDKEPDQIDTGVDSDNLQNGDTSGMMMGFQAGCRSERGDDMDYYTDDIFSSFINSLINDDIFVQQQQQQQSSVEPLISASGFGYGAFWDSAISSAPGVNDDEHGRTSFVDHASKRF